MPDAVGLDRKIFSFVYGLVAAFGAQKAEAYVIRKWGENSPTHLYLKEHFIKLARDVHDHIVEQPKGQPIFNFPRQAENSHYDRGLAAYQKQDWSRAYLSFLEAEKTGNADAANYLGLIYWKDLLKTKKRLPDIHFIMAIDMFDKAIADGDKTYAARNLCGVGFDYEKGNGVPVNLAAGARCYEKAARAGCAQAMFNTAVVYREGQGVAKDWAIARHWYGLLAERTDADSLELAGKARHDLAWMDAQEQREGNGARSGGRMTRAEALEILDLNEGVTKDEMRAAYKRLMLNVHPDKGGSTYFAKQLNEAREVLGF